MKLKNIAGMSNPWNAFQSAFTEHPFDVYAMRQSQVAMFYHTMKDHLDRHVEALSPRPTGSLWDYVPEPRLHIARPLINDAQPANEGVVDPDNEGFGEAAETIRCLGCGRFMHDHDVYPCLYCHATPFHLECLETHYEKTHPKPQEAKKKEEAEEEEILQQEADEACSRWVDQMSNLANSAMPLGRKIASIVVALTSVWLACEPFWSPGAADAPVPLLQ